MEFDKSQITILIVDDTPENISLLAEYLVDYKIKVATDGPMALTRLESGSLPSIILLDIMMPGMDGYEVIKRIKRNPLTKDIPIIAMSESAEITDKMKGFQLGAVDYITKPFQLEEVNSRVEAHISLGLYRRELENINELLEHKVQERTHELLLSKDKAEEGSRLKSHFLTLMSHELRTPMVGILGYSEALMGELNEPILKEFAENLNDSALRLKDMLESILILTKVESQTQSVQPVLFNLPERVGRLLKSHMLNASLKGLKLSLVNRVFSGDVYIDRTMFDIVFNNLVSNAVKFTESGTVIIELYEEHINGKMYICTKISDTGIGIPLEKQKEIFKEFTQVHEGIERNFKGLGLGLCLTKKYVEQMLGFIEVESEVDKGSTFTVKFEFAGNVPEQTKNGCQDEGGVSSPKPISGPKPKILVVEDDRIVIQVTKLFLSEIVDLDIAYDGVSAIELATNNTYAAILMDINLGKGLSGIDATKAIRELHQYKKTPIVAFTAFALDGDEKSFLAEGCTHYIPKPFNRKKLVDLVTDLVY